MKTFDGIYIIYNPNSTGPSQANAEQLRDGLATDERMPVKVVATERAGHAEELAYTYATHGKSPLVISSSGDGGYHEVVNGIMKANDEGHSATAGLLPSGNANDHYENLHEETIEKLIINGDSQAVDLLHMAVTSPSGDWQRYAHSYIGFGLTPAVAVELNKTSTNLMKEAWMVLKCFVRLHSFVIEHEGKQRRYDSLIFSNVNKMSKVLSLSDNASMDDGKFEVTAFRRRNKFALLRKLIKAATVGLNGEIQTDAYTFRTLRRLKVQLDGEIYEVPAAARVTITIVPKALKSIV